MNSTLPRGEILIKAKIMKYFLLMVGGALSIFLILSGAHGWFVPEKAVFLLKPNENLSLITEPADGVAPVISMITSASTSIDLVIYELADQEIENDIAAAHGRGIRVRVLLSRGYYGEPSKVNGQAYTFFQSQNIPVKWTSSNFALTHEKSLIVDGNAVLIMTFNLMAQYYSTGRDFALIDKDQADVRAIESTFDADWQGNQIASLVGDDLIWSPGSEDRTLAMIHGATSTLDVYNEEMADQNVTDALESAAKRGVIVRVIMTYASEWKSAFRELSNAGAQIRTYAKKAPLYIHAKMILADGRISFIGSQNFSETSQNENRELGIELVDRGIIKSLLATFNEDWRGAKLFL
jgi:cardiolipin synthase